MQAQESAPPGPELAIPSADTKPQELTNFSPLAKVVEINNLCAKGKTPFHLQLSFQLFDLSGKPEEKGSLETWWAGDAGSALAIETPSLGKLNGFQQTSESTNQARRSIFLIRQLFNEIVDPASPLRSEGNTVSTNTAEGKVELTCTYVEPEGSKRPALAYPHVCIGKIDNTVRLVTEPAKAVLRNQLGKFANTLVALDVQVTLSGRQAIRGHIEKLESFSPDHAPTPLKTNALFSSSVEGNHSVPAAGAGHVFAGRKISGNNPVYPPSARTRRIAGSVMLGILIAKDGSVSALFPIASPDPSLTEAAIDAVKTWTYTPYLLNGAPTEVNTTVTVNFDLRPS